MRISSSQYFSMNVQTMSDQQATLASMYQQISSGTRLLTASDDPLGAAQAVAAEHEGRRRSRSTPRTRVRRFRRCNRKTRR